MHIVLHLLPVRNEDVRDNMHLLTPVVLNENVQLI